MVLLNHYDIMNAQSPVAWLVETLPTMYAPVVYSRIHITEDT